MKTLITSSKLLLLCILMSTLFGFNSYNKSKFLKQESDTIVVTGNLIYANKEPFISKNVDLWPVNEKKERVLVMENGLFGNPSVQTDSNGFFKISFHKKILRGNNAFTLTVQTGITSKPLVTEDGGSLIFEIDSMSRVINVGKIIVKP